MLFSIACVLAICQFVMGVDNHMRYPPYEQTLYACNYQIRNTARFCNPKIVPNCVCVNKNHMATMMGCAKMHNPDFGKLMKFYIHYCDSIYETTNVTTEILQSSLQYFEQAAVYPNQIPNFNKTTIVNVPIKLDEKQKNLLAQAYNKFLGNFNRSVDYSGWSIGYWGIIMLFAAIGHWSRILFPNLVFKLTDPITTYWRKYVTIPAINRRVDQPLTFRNIPLMLIPARWESLVIFMFVILIIGLNASLYHWDPNDPLFTSKTVAVNRYCADRTGIIGTFLVPLLLLFSGRNNFLQFVTGLHYTTFITYHKWIARVATILVVIHSICYTIALGSRYNEEVKERYLLWGVIGIIFMCLIVFQASLYFRRRWYEIFLLIHFVFSFLFIVGTWIHVIDLGYGSLMFASAAVWGFDRIVRIIRLCWFGIAKAKVILLADETLRIVVPKPKTWKMTPGGYAFIHFLRPSCFWQSHPFTFCENPTNPQEIILYCKVKGGITHGLYKYLATCPENTATIRVTLEGPYGEAAPVKRYDRAVYIASGNGIPGIYSEVYNGMIKCKNDRQEIKLIWIIREYRSLVWFYEELKSLRNDRVKVVIYVTNPSSTEYLTELTKIISNDDEELKKDTDSEDSNNVLSMITRNPQFDHLEFRQGRPNLKEIVVTEMIESPGPIAFVTCGHPAMVDTLRYDISENINRAQGKRVDFFNQLEVWA